MEEWRKIEDYPEYQVSNTGNVKSFKRDKIEGKIMKQTTNKEGYLYLSLCKDEKKKKLKVHRLVALAFLDNPDGYDIVDHIDRNRTNNHLSNLRWVNGSMNNFNKGKQKNNKAGYKNIDTEIKHGNEYWRIQIQSFKIQKSFRKTKYTLDQVVAERNKYYAQYNLTD